jgi:hypothetical protein
MPAKMTGEMMIPGKSLGTAVAEGEGVGQEVPVCIGTFPLAMHDCKISKYEAYATAKIYK